MKIDQLYSLKGKVAIVTGASRGLGKRMALALADAGANLVLSARNVELLNETANEIKEKGVKTLVTPADTTNASKVEAMAKKAIETFGKIDVLLNNAGVGSVKPFLKFTEEDWDTIIATNVKGYFLCCQAVLPTMLEQKKGSIINISSVMGTGGMGFMVPYAASKGAVSAMTRALAVEFAPSSIRVNAIAPSYFESDMTTAAQSDERTNKFIISKTPLGRWGKAEELDGVVVFLASDASSYVTGEVINVDGGWMAT